jgi:subtilisin family serine protease
VINMSYGIMFNKNVPISIASLSPREASIASYAKQGQAVAVKSAGNDGVNMGSVTAAGTVDQLSRLLRGSQSGIFVGSLKTNGSKEALASMASYSNKAGKDSAYQKQFLVVGVDTAQIRIAGTSFAAPIVSGYAAILGSKFTTATPTQVTNQLLNTARQDTVANYSREVHGRGEASLSRALAPTAIR